MKPKNNKPAKIPENKKKISIKKENLGKVFIHSPNSQMKESLSILEKNIEKSESNEKIQKIEKAIEKEKIIEEENFTEFFQSSRAKIAPVLEPFESPKKEENLEQTASSFQLQETKKEKSDQGFNYTLAIQEKEGGLKYLPTIAHHPARIDITAQTFNPLERSEFHFRKSEERSFETGNIQHYHSTERLDLEKERKRKPFEKEEIKYFPSSR